MNSTKRITQGISVLPFLLASQLALADGWDHNLAVYLWGSDIAGKTQTGQSIDVEFSDLVDNLELAGMVAYQGKSGQWSALVDLIYVDISAEERVELLPPVGGGNIQGGVDASLDMESWVVSAGAGYEFQNDGEGTFTEFVFGARYLDLSSDLMINFDVSIPEQPPVFNADLGDSVIDAIVGFRGVIRTGARWYMPWGANVGTGESDLTWQAHVGVGYQATETFHIVASYRYLKWEFDNDTPMADLEMYGPQLGAVWRF